MNHTLSNFMSDFILGGLIIAISSMFIRNSKSELGGFIYGALPIGFVYLYLLGIIYSLVMILKLIG